MTYGQVHGHVTVNLVMPKPHYRLVYLNANGERRTWRALRSQMNMIMACEHIRETGGTPQFVVFVKPKAKSKETP